MADWASPRKIWWSEWESLQTASALWQLYQKKLSIMKRQYYIARKAGAVAGQQWNDQQLIRMSIINSQKFKHRKRISTEAQSVSMHTEASTKSIIQPYATKKKPYRHLQIDTINEFATPKPHSKSLTRNQHTSSQSLRIRKTKSIISISAANEQRQAGKSLRYAQQLSEEEKSVNESDRQLNGGLADKQMKRRKLRRRLERAEREGREVRAEMRVKMANLQEQFNNLRNVMHLIGKTIKNDVKQSSLLQVRNRNASARIIARFSARILKSNMCLFFEGLLQA